MSNLPEDPITDASEPVLPTGPAADMTAFERAVGVAQIGSDKVTGRNQPERSDPRYPNRPAPEPT